MRILAVLEQEELSVGELTRALDTPQSTISRHLKALRTEGWVARRAEGTAGWFRALPREGASGTIWSVVLEQSSTSPEHVADRQRLEGVLAARAIDSETFFGRMHDRWAALRRELFGDGFVQPTLLALMDEDLCVADLGCGTGETVAALAPVARTVIGVDREPAMIRAAEQRTSAHANVQLRAGGLEDLPLADGEADMAVCMLVLHHVADLERAFAEMRRTVSRRLIVLDMLAHDRDLYRRTMGHRHLGFDRDALVATAEAHGWCLQRWTDLQADETAKGPPLFIAIFS